MNILEIFGHLGADPEARFTPSGLKVTTLRVATKVHRKGKDETIWFRVTIWGDRFDKMIAYLKKGSAVVAVGEMDKPEIYTDREGRPQISLEMTAEFIRFSPFGKPDRPQDQEGPSAQAQPQQYNYENKAPGQNFSASPEPFGGGFQNSGRYQGPAEMAHKSSDSEDEMPF